MQKNSNNPMIGLIAAAVLFALVATGLVLYVKVSSGVASLVDAVPKQPPGAGEPGPGTELGDDGSPGPGTDDVNPSPGPGTELGDDGSPGPGTDDEGSVAMPLIEPDITAAEAIVWMQQWADAYGFELVVYEASVADPSRVGYIVGTYPEARAPVTDGRIVLYVGVTAGTGGDVPEGTVESDPVEDGGWIVPGEFVDAPYSDIDHLIDQFAAGAGATVEHWTVEVDDPSLHDVVLSLTPGPGQTLYPGQTLVVEVGYHATDAHSDGSSLSMDFYLDDNTYTAYYNGPLEQEAASACLIELAAWHRAEQMYFEGQFGTDDDAAAIQLAHYIDELLRSELALGGLPWEYVAELTEQADLAWQWVEYWSNGGERPVYTVILPLATLDVCWTGTHL